MRTSNPAPVTRVTAASSVSVFAGGSVVTVDETKQVSDLAHRRGLRVHLDGARIFNAAVALGKPVAEITRKCDSVMFCLSKGLGAPVGSVRGGSDELIKQARVYRKSLVGGMRQAGVLAAAGLHALDHNLERLAEDHANARDIGAALSGIDGVRVVTPEHPTNIVLIEVDADAPAIAAAASHDGVLVTVMGPHALRCVTHLDVDAAGCRRGAAVLARLLAQQPVTTG